MALTLGRAVEDAGGRRAFSSLWMDWQIHGNTHAHMCEPSVIRWRAAAQFFEPVEHHAQLVRLAQLPAVVLD